MLAVSRFKFALESLKKCTSMESKNNIFFSPHLVYHTLLVMYFGANNDTEESLKKVLHIPSYVSKTNIQEYYSSLGINEFCYIMNGLNEEYTCRIFSRLFINECKVIYAETMTLFSTGHQVKEMNVDIRPDHTRNFINNTVYCISQKCIKNILPPDSIDSETDAILLNVIYCDGQLDYSVNDTSDSIKKKTEEQENERKKDKKRSTGKIGVGKLDAYIMEIPYKEKGISTFLIFPSDSSKSAEKNLSEEDKIIQLIERLMTEEGSRELQKLLDYGLTYETDIVFPTFNIEHDLNMYQLLDKLGLQEFLPLGAGLLPEFSCNTIKLGGAVHRFSMKITQTRITIAATNIFFTCDREDKKTQHTTAMCSPCVCLVYDRVQRNILFCGILSEKTD